VGWPKEPPRIGEKKEGEFHKNGSRGTGQTAINGVIGWGRQRKYGCYRGEAHWVKPRGRRKERKEQLKSNFISGKWGADYRPP